MLKVIPRDRESRIDAVFLPRWVGINKRFKLRVGDLGCIHIERVNVDGSDGLLLIVCVYVVAAHLKRACGDEHHPLLAQKFGFRGQCSCL